MFKILGLVGGASALHSHLTDVGDKWDAFKSQFGKSYTAEEELQRFKNFVSNLENMEKLSQIDPEAQYSHMTPFADMTEQEMTTRKGFKPNLSKKFKTMPTEKLDTSGLPDSFDWREKGAVNDVKNQGQCGSCWSFATVANIEGQNFVSKGSLVSLSEQELVDCSANDNGCNGGLPENAYEDMINNKMGLESEADYGYHAADGNCSADKSKEVVFIDSWQAIDKDEDQIRAALIKYGPLAIGINASWMQLYFGGISNPPFCDPTQLDHGVAIVGYGEEDGKPYWVIRNSWGPSWGEAGYYRIIRNKGKCGLNTMVTSAVINSTIDQ